MEVSSFITVLASKNPTPGGGGASALVGAVGSALCAMVGNLTTGKAKYVAVQADIDRLLPRATKMANEFLALIKDDEAAFQPLSKAYSLPKDTPNRDAILENALIRAAKPPMAILEKCTELAALCEEFAEKGSRLAVSDAGVAAAACEAAAKGAALNVYVNTRLMKNRTDARLMNKKAETYEAIVLKTCSEVYEKVKDTLL